MSLTSTIAGWFALMLLVLWGLYAFNKNSFFADATCDLHTCPRTANCYGYDCDPSCSTDKTTCSQNCSTKDCQTACYAGVERCKQDDDYREMSCGASEKCRQKCNYGTCSLSCDNTKECDQECSYEKCNALCGSRVKNCSRNALTGIIAKKRGLSISINKVAHMAIIATKHVILVSRPAHKSAHIQITVRWHAILKIVINWANTVNLVQHMARMWQNARRNVLMAMIATLNLTMESRPGNKSAHIRVRAS